MAVKVQFNAFLNSTSFRTWLVSFTVRPLYPRHPFDRRFGWTLGLVLRLWRVRAMAQAVSRRPLTAEARVRSRVSPCRICGG
jgi:hypothetical protein